MHSVDSAPEPAALGNLVADAALTIYTVEDFSTRCQAVLGCARDLRLDLSAVTTCDTLGVQLLLAIRRGADSAGKSITFVNPSTAVQRAAAAIACESLFTRTGVCP